MVMWQGNLVASYFNETRMWDLKEGKLVKEIIFSFSLNGNEAEREKITSPIKTLTVSYCTSKAHVSDNVCHIQVLENGWLVVGLETPPVICVFDRECNNIRTTAKLEKSVFAMVPLQNARGVVSVDGSGKLKVWYLGGWADTHQGHHSLLAASSSKEKEKEKEKDKDYFEGKLIQELGGHEHQTYCIAWWNGRLYTGDFLGVIRMWK